MPHNEDALLIGENVLTEGSFCQDISEPFIAAVSDGVSGELGGELASKMSLELIRDMHYSGIIRLDIRLHEIHRQLAEYSRQNPENHNMQATLCGIAVDETEGYFPSTSEIQDYTVSVREESHSFREISRWCSFFSRRALSLLSRDGLTFTEILSFRRSEM